MTPSDHNLEDRAKEGDEDALALLLEQHGPAVQREIARRIPRRCRSVVSDDDVMQQTYVDAFRGIRRFIGVHEGSFHAWLAAVANRNLLDVLRMLGAEKRGGDRRRVPADAGDDSYVTLYEQLSASTSTPSRKAARHEALSLMMRAVESLPPDHRRVVELYDLEGRPVEEVATALSRSPGAVYMLRSRAHRLLCEIMGASSKYLSRFP